MLKKTKKIILLLSLALLPFGQLDSLLISSIFPNAGIRIHLIDLLAVASISITIIEHKKSKEDKWLANLIVAVLFSLFFSLTTLKTNEIYIGLFYAIRFIAYISLFLVARGYKREKADINFDSLLMLSGVVSAVIGIVQYFAFPDLRVLKYIQWDDHYFRLTSLFLDPAFTGIIFVLTFIIAFHKNKKSLSLFLLLTILLTYSRASFISVFLVLIYFLLKSKKKLITLLYLIFFLTLIPVLPRPQSEGVKLERTNSVVAKYLNYKESIKIFKTSPIFGVGFNNICSVKRKLNIAEAKSHSCSGLDNSILFILTTTGTLGLFIFIHSFSRIVSNIEEKDKERLVYPTALALLVHSQFTNTLFYPWVMLWLAFFFAQRSYSE